MADPQWDDLRIFLAVAREESLSGAGRILRLDPATIGRRIARLEAAVEMPLFVKSPQGYRLSAAGEQLMRHGESAERALRMGVESLTGTSSGRLTGQIRLGAPDGCANYLLPRICAGIARDHPDLDIHIVALPRVINLSRREADMAITVSAPTAGQLLVQKITDYRLHLVAARSYLREQAPFATVADLKGHPVIGYIPDMIFDSELDYLAELNVARVPLASNSVPVQLNLVAEGSGLCVAHDFALPFHKGLRKVLEDEISMTRSFYLVRHQGDQKSDRLNRFSALLLDGMRSEVARLESLT